MVRVLELIGVVTVDGSRYLTTMIGKPSSGTFGNSDSIEFIDIGGSKQMISLSRIDAIVPMTFQRSKWIKVSG